MAYIASDKIGVFPLSKNRTSNTPLNSRLFYENNVTNIINQLIDTDGFVITDNSGTILDNNTFTVDFKFNLYGYYFEITSGSSLSETITSGPLYAAIILSGTPKEIKGQDHNSNYEGLIITTQEGLNSIINELDTGEILKFLKILDSDFKIPHESKLKFNIPSLNITAIDGKH